MFCSLYKTCKRYKVPLRDFPIDSFALISGIGFRFLSALRRRTSNNFRDFREKDYVQLRVIKSLKYSRCLVSEKLFSPSESWRNHTGKS